MSDEPTVLQTPGGGHYRRINALPDDERTLLREMVNAQRETNERLAKIERELLGEEGDRERGLVFRLTDLERQAALVRWVGSAVTLAVIGLIIAKIASVMEGKG